MFPNSDSRPDDDARLDELTGQPRTSRILLDLAGATACDADDPRLVLIRRLNRALAPWPKRRRSNRPAIGR